MTTTYERIISELEARLFGVDLEVEGYDKNIYRANKKSIEKDINKLEKQYSLIKNKHCNNKDTKEYIKDLVLCILSSSIENYKMKYRKSSDKIVLNYKKIDDEIKIQISRISKEKDEGIIEEYVSNITELIDILTEYLIPHMEIGEESLVINSIRELEIIETMIFLIYRTEPIVLPVYI